MQKTFTIKKHCFQVNFKYKFVATINIYSHLHNPISDLGYNSLPFKYSLINKNKVQNEVGFICVEVT